MSLRKLIMIVGLMMIVFIVCFEVASCETYYFVSSNNKNIIYVFDVEEGKYLLKDVYERLEYDSIVFSEYAFKFYNEEFAKFINTRIVDGTYVSTMSCECNCLEIFKDIRGCKLENHLIVNYDPRYGSLAFKIYYYTRTVVIITAKAS